MGHDTHPQRPIAGSDWAAPGEGSRASVYASDTIFQPTASASA